MNLFVTAIDTDAGKTVATGLMGRFRMRQGRRVITQKLVQTGIDGAAAVPREASEELDVAVHRQIMEMPWTEADRCGDTCPYVFRLPASPHLAAEQEGALIDTAVLSAATDRLAAVYDDVIIEGVGGLCVPLTRDGLLVDYVADRGYRTVLVTGARLGSINHTLLSLAVLAAKRIPVAGLIYNRQHDGCEHIVRDSRAVFERALEDHGYAPRVVDMPVLTQDASVDFGPLFETACS